MTLKRLAHALGVNERTMYKLRLRGAPNTLDESAWRAWCEASGVPIRPPMTVELDDTLPGVPRGTVGVHSAPATDPGTSHAPNTADAAELKAPTSYAQLSHARGAELKRLQAERVEIEIAEKRRLLISRDDVRRVVSAFANAIVFDLVDFPAQVARALPAEFPPELIRPLRKTIEREIEAMRGRISAVLRDRVRDALTVRSSSPAAAPTASASTEEKSDG